MNTKTKSEIEQFVNELYPAFSYNYQEVSVADDCKSFTVSRMYEFVDLEFKHLKAVSDFFDTLNVSTNQDARRGCDTCDYGSEYSVIFYVE